MVLFHQPVEVGSIRVRDRQERYCARTDEAPCRVNISGMVIKEVEDFSQHRGGRGEGQA